ncbi:MAG TPA: hypothetical protein VIE65_13615, partial [Methylobacter sp.]
TNTNLAHVLGNNKEFTASDLGDDGKINDQTETKVYHLTIDVHGKKLRTHSIVWSPVTAPAKRKLCYDQEKKSKACLNTSGDYPYERASLNSKLKDSLVNDCLSDAVIYAGDLRDKIQNQVKIALLQSLGDGDANKTLDALVAKAEVETKPLFFISESLGSKVLFDTLLIMKNEGGAMARVVERTLDRTMQVFMGANQIPLLSLALDYVPTSAASHKKSPAFQIFEDPLDALGNEYNTVKKRQGALSTHGQPDALQVIAFTDPDDLLSYPLKGSDQDGKKSYKLTDVVVSNASTWFGFLENPLKAHTDYLNNPAVQRLVACGYPEWSKCE